ncbi:unnamed protein product [Arctia plantaginis]|uniref:Uncharacterized protein n=1 Tax=Arctia plantaginis TaxID=874455 RepID=A0A8S0YT92_ARCPL|nr:unnamed protein product [Arctia plantaginis]
MGQSGLDTRPVALFMDEGSKRLGIGFGICLRCSVTLSPGIAALIRGDTRKNTVRRGGACAVLTALGGDGLETNMPRKISVDVMVVKYESGVDADYLGCVKASRALEIVVYEDDKDDEKIYEIMSNTPKRFSPHVILKTEILDLPMLFLVVSGSMISLIKLSSIQRMPSLDKTRIIPFKGIDTGDIVTPTLGSTKWIFVESQKTKISIQYNANITDLVVSGTGILCLKPQCVAFCRNVKLLSVSELELFGHEVNLDFNLIDDKCCNLSKLKELKVDLPNITISNSDLQSLKNLKTLTDQTEKYLDNLDVKNNLKEILKNLSRKVRCKKSDDNPVEPDETEEEPANRLILLPRVLLLYFIMTLSSSCARPRKITPFWFRKALIMSSSVITNKTFLKISSESFILHFLDQEVDAIFFQLFSGFTPFLLRSKAQDHWPIFRFPDPLQLLSTACLI